MLVENLQKKVAQGVVKGKVSLFLVQFVLCVIPCFLQVSENVF